MIHKLDTGRHSNENNSPNASRWKWLAGTYWYVPAANTPAMIYDSTNRSLIPVRDQTVFHITGYRKGYLWGISITQFGSSAPICSSMIGSITPQGAVLLNFTPMGDSSTPSITQGIGRMRVKAGQWTMENQMFTPSEDDVQIGHWAYMVQTRPGQRSWRSLPVARQSVPQFLSICPDSGPKPFGG